MTLSATEFTLLDRWQRNFPFIENPFAVVGQSVGLDEEATIAAFARLRELEVISRIGAVVKPNTVGASTLAAMQVPAARLQEVAAAVSAEPLVNHNYEREHDLNLWFVIAGPDAGHITDTVSRIEECSGLPVMNLPLVRSYHIDLGFPLTGAPKRNGSHHHAVDYRPDHRDRSILATIEDGLPLVARPYHDIGKKTGFGEYEVIGRLKQLSAGGIVTRFGCVVRHRVLGYTANAMAVWDVPDHIVDVVAGRFVRNPQVTLCYSRPRRRPAWPYNLFCMIHARTRDAALATVGDLNAIAESGLYEQTVLFSTHCFKQRGAVFSEQERELH